MMSFRASAHQIPLETSARILPPASLGGTWVFILTCLLSALNAEPLWAITIRHDVSASSYTSHAAQSQFEAVGYLVVPGTDVTGTVVGDGTWVLTAAHAVDQSVIPSQVSLNINSNTYQATQIVIHPGWNLDPLSGNDLALVKLSTPVTGITPANIYTGSSELGETGDLIGLGATGTGDTGNTGNGQSIARGAQNIIDAFVTDTGAVTTTDGPTARGLFADFDAPVGYLDPELRVPPNATGSPIPLGLEGCLNVGDSGSPLFIQVGSNWLIAGVGSGVITEQDLYGMGDPSIDNRLADYGDAMLWTRVSTSSEFILETIPEPSTAVLAALGGMALGAFRRKVRRSKPR